MWNDTDRAFSGLGRGVSEALALAYPQLMANKRQEQELSSAYATKAMEEAGKTARLNKTIADENKDNKYQYSRQQLSYISDRLKQLESLYDSATTASDRNKLRIQIEELRNLGNLTMKHTSALMNLPLDGGKKKDAGLSGLSSGLNIPL